VGQQAEDRRPAVNAVSHPIYGVDAVQALTLAFELAGSVLASSPEARRGDLEWYERPPFGFPCRVTVMAPPTARPHDRSRRATTSS
jgi:hypothetical protein